MKLFSPKKLIFFALVFFSIGTILVSCSNEPKVITAEELARLAEPLMNVNKMLIAKDSDLIVKYAKRHSWELKMTKTGLWYQIYERGSDKPIKRQNIVSINYRVSLLDGTLCYTSDSLGVKTFKVGQGGIERGIDEGVLMMHQCDKAHFILPPHLAYGLLGDQKNIPARATIVYDVEVIQVD